MRARVNKPVLSDELTSEQEKRLLGALYAYPRHIPFILASLGSTDVFLTPEAGMMAELYRKHYDPEKGLDKAAITTSVGDLKYLHQIVAIAQDTDPSIDSDPAMLLAWAEGIREGHDKRVLARELHALADSLGLADTDLQSARAKAMSRIASMERVERLGLHTLESLEEDALKEVEMWQEGIASGYYLTGFPGLDAIVRMPKSEISVFGAVTGGGKTSVGVQIALHVAKQILADYKGGGEPPLVVFFSAEMTATQVMHRMASALTGISQDRLIRGAKQREFDDYKKALRHIASTLPIVIDDTSAPTTEYILNRCIQLNATRGVEFFLFDYIEKARIADMRFTGDDDQIRVSRVVEDLHTVARTVDAHGFLLSQFSRAIFARSDKTPRLSDLRASGRVEQEAFLVILLHSPYALFSQGLRDLDPEQYAPGFYKTHFIVAKQRNGGFGDAPMLFEPEASRFRDMTRAPSSGSLPI